MLSTLHTNDSAGAVTRLVDMGVEPFLVSATLEGVLAQRLLRTICKSCRSPYEPSLSILNQLGLTPEDLGGKHFYTGSGCSVCGNSGYKGRKGLYELLDVTDPIRELITGRAPSIAVSYTHLDVYKRQIQASLTGHLVFSTLHTNDAPSAVARLTDIGVKPVSYTHPDVYKRQVCRNRHMKQALLLYIFCSFNLTE